MTRERGGTYLAGAAPVTATALILAPLLRPGVAIAYDMPWSPEPRWTPFVLGLDTPAPRAVPSDAFAVLIGTLIGPGVAQLLILAAILVGAGGGAMRLLGHLAPGCSIPARAVAGTFAVWNPYVVERLAVGQWAVLLGYAIVPWAVLAALRARRGGPALHVAVATGLAGLGGANAVVVVGLPTLVVLLAPRPRWREAGVVTLAAVGVSAAWALPALTAAAARTTVGATAFLPRADTPFGLLLSAVSGGAFWNPASWPAGRSTGINAAAATILGLLAATWAIRRLARPAAGRAFVAAALAGLVVVALSGLPSARDLWGDLIGALPGGGILRDSQKLLAPWVVLLAMGSGLLVDAVRLSTRGRALVGATLVALPVALLPGGAWGVGGRLDPTVVPPDYLRVAAQLSAAEPGLVGVLPWRQYRRYGWNERRISLTLVPRLVDQRTLYDDSLPLSSGLVPGEDGRSAEVTRAIGAGASPFEALGAAGVRYVAVEKRTGLEDVVAPTSARLLASSADLDVYELQDRPSSPAAATSSTPVRAGWAASLATWAGLVGLWLRRLRRSRSYRPVC